MSEPKKHRVETQDELADFLNQIRPGEHVLLFYTGIEHKHRALFTLIQVGLDRGEAVVYVASEETPEQVRKAMAKHGIDVKRHEESGALKILDYKDVYIINGRFHGSRTRALWKRLHNEAMEKGFKGMRAVGEMFCFFEAGLTKELLEYERSIHHTPETPMTAICAYNSELLERMGIAELLLSLIQTHIRAGFSRRSLDLLKIHRIRLIENMSDTEHPHEGDTERTAG